MVTPSLARFRGGRAIFSTNANLVRETQWPTPYFESIIGPEIEKNAGPLIEAGMSVD